MTVSAGLEVSRQRAHPVAKLCHGRRRADALPDDVADDEPQPAVGQRQCVEPVAADVHGRRSGEVERRDACALHRRHGLRENAPLQRLRHDALALVPPRTVEREAALRRDRLEEAALVLTESAGLRPGEPSADRAAPALNGRKANESRPASASVSRRSGWSPSRLSRSW